MLVPLSQFDTAAYNSPYDTKLLLLMKAFTHYLINPINGLSVGTLLSGRQAEIFVISAIFGKFSCSDRVKCYF